MHLLRPVGRKESTMAGIVANGNEREREYFYIFFYIPALQNPVAGTVVVCTSKYKYYAHFKYEISNFNLFYNNLDSSKKCIYISY